MMGIKFLFDLMAAKIAQIDSDFDWLNSTPRRHWSQISEWRHINRKRTLKILETER